VAIAANATYVAGYFAANAHFAYTQNAFASAGVDNGVLHALADAAAGGNGVYAKGSSSVFPNLSYLAPTTGSMSSSAVFWCRWS